MNITACGDIALCRGIASMIMANQGDELVQDFRDIFERSDLVIANIECPLTDSEIPAWKYFPTLKGPRQGGSLLRRLGIDVASLANNHIADYGLIGLNDTIATLKEQGITPVGAGLSAKEATQPAIVKITDISVAVIALAQPEISAAKHDRWGAGILDRQEIIRQIGLLKNDVDIIVVYLHFGVEWFNYPTPHQVRMSRALIDAGAKLVIGHHPHAPQGFEHYHGGFIAYSLGNFIFDMSSGSHKFSRLGLVIEAEFDRNILNRVNIIPVDTRGGNPRLLSDKDRQEAEVYLRNLCYVLEDEKELIRNYYYTCRDNLRIHLNAFIHFGLKRVRAHRTWDLLASQFWPQILRLRIDLLRFLLSGDALVIEKLKRTSSPGTGSVLWLWICRLFKIIGLGWGRLVKII